MELAMEIEAQLSLAHSVQLYLHSGWGHKVPDLELGQTLEHVALPRRIPQIRNTGKLRHYSSISLEERHFDVHEKRKSHANLVDFQK